MWPPSSSDVFQSLVFVAVAVNLLIIVHFAPSIFSEALSNTVDLVSSYKTAYDLHVPSIRISNTLSEVGARNLSEAFEKFPWEQQPTRLLSWINLTFRPNKTGPTWVQMTSFGPQGIALLHHIQKLDLIRHTRIVTVDTLHLFPETYDLIAKAKDFFKLGDNLKVYKSLEGSRENFEKAYGSKLWKVDLQLFEFLTKIEPTRRALNELGVLAWVTGRRRSQGGERSHLPLVEVDQNDNRVKVNPFVVWEREDVWKYIKKHNLPYNALHDRGYTSIGDTISTDKSSEFDSERAGRWKSVAGKSECGIHLPMNYQSLQDFVTRSKQLRHGYLWDYDARAEATKLGIKIVTEETFEQDVVTSKENILIDIYAPWCPHCRLMDPEFRKLASLVASDSNHTFRNSLKLARMDGWQNHVPAAYSDKFNVEAFPSLYLVMKKSSLRVSRYGSFHHSSFILNWVRQELAKR